MEFVNRVKFIVKEVTWVSMKKQESSSYTKWIWSFKTHTSFSERISKTSKCFQLLLSNIPFSYRKRKQFRYRSLLRTEIIAAFIWFSYLYICLHVVYEFKILATLYKECELNSVCQANCKYRPKITSVNRQQPFFSTHWALEMYTSTKWTRFRLNMETKLKSIRKLWYMYLISFWKFDVTV